MRTPNIRAQRDHFMSRIMHFQLVWAAALVLPLLTSCAFTQWEYDHGITRYEGFKEPTRVLVSRADGSTAVEVDSFYYSPAEALQYFDEGKPRRPFWERIPPRPTSRRYLVASGDTIEKLIHRESKSSFRNTPFGTLNLPVRLKPLQAQYKWQATFTHWSIIPAEFDAPSATENDLPDSFKTGYDVYPWQKPVAHTLVTSSKRDQYYYAWENPVPWRTKEEKTWRLNFSIRAYPEVARHERRHISLDWFKPVFLAADIITAPLQIVAAPILYGFAP